VKGHSAYLTARRAHTCTRCGGVIDRGDHYHRDAVPPWALGDWSEGRWEVRKTCHDCSGVLAA
jgi:hypothetical protein